MTNPLDSQVGGDHYKKLGDYQPWNVLPKWLNKMELKGFMKGTVIAYLAREEDKGGDADIEKAFHTMELYFEAIREPGGLPSKPAETKPDIKVKKDLTQIPDYFGMSA